MKKSISIVARVVLMIDGLTACSNNTPTSPIMGKQVEGITLASAPDYLVDVDTIDAADLKLRVLFNDNSTMDYTGTELNAEVPARVISAESTSIAVPYGSLKFYVTVPAYEIEGLTADVSKAEQTEIVKPEAGETATLSLDGVVWSATYNGGSSRVLTADDVTELGIPTEINEIPESAFTDLGVGDVFVEISAGSYTYAGKTFTVTGEWTVTVGEEEKAAITSVDLEQTGDNEIFYVGTSNVISGASLKGVVTYSDGEEVPISYGVTGANALFTDADEEFVSRAGEQFTIVLQDTKSDLTLTSSRKSVTVSAVVVDNTTGAESDPFNLTIKSVEDYPKAVTIEPTKDGEKDRVWDWEDPISVSQFSFTVGNEGSNWASGNTYTDDTNPGISKTSWSLDKNQVKVGAAASYPVTFTYTGELGTKTGNKLEKTINITVEHETEPTA